MAIYKANNKYRATLRSTWVASPAATTMAVTAVPDNFPTYITAGWNESNETLFTVTGYSGTSPADYTLTGVTRVSGANENLPENTALNCLNVAEFFNQYAGVISDDFIRLDDGTSDPDTPATDKAIFYIKNGSPFVVLDTGVSTQVGFKSDEWIEVDDAATMTIDLSETIKKLKYKMGPLTDDRAFAISNADEGMVFLVRVMQDGTGSRTPTWFPVTTDEVTMTIANPGVVTTTKDLRTGTPVTFTTTDTLPTGITAGTKYYWIRTSATTGNVATSKANAIAGTTITTSGSQAGTHTMSVGIIWAGDEVGEFTTDKYAYDDFAFTVHDDNTITGIKVAGEY